MQMQTVKLLRGVIRGKQIELETETGFDDGQSVEVLLRTELETPPPGTKPLPGPPPLWKPGQVVTVAGALADDWTEEDDRILAEIYADRQRDKGRDLDE